MNLKSDAKLRRVLAISKYLGLIFAELLRRDRLDATKGGQRPKSCRMNKENGAPKPLPRFRGLVLTIRDNLLGLITFAVTIYTHKKT
jgi:hypothetical protein